ncbi:MAG: hypothetical protein AAGE99_05205 [Chlamydiota bacterium]
MKNAFEVHINRFGNGRTEKIDETLSPKIIDIDEEDLRFKHPIRLSGKAYPVRDRLMIQLKIETEVEIRCLICNEPTPKKIIIPCFYHTKEIATIKGDIYDCTNPVREAVVLEIPSFVECMENCPKRLELKNYLSKGETRLPFADLN